MLRNCDKIPYRKSVPLTLDLNNSGFYVKFDEYGTTPKAYMFDSTRHMVYKDSVISSIITRLDTNIFRIDINFSIYPRNKSTPDEKYIQTSCPFANSPSDARDANLKMYFNLNNPNMTPNVSELNEVGLKELRLKDNQICLGFGNLSFEFGTWDLDHILMSMVAHQENRLIFQNVSRESLSPVQTSEATNNLYSLNFNGYGIFEVEDAALMPEKKPKVNFNIFSQKPSKYQYKGGVNLC